MNGQRVETEIGNAMIDYSNAINAHKIAMFDVTQIERLGVKVEVTKEGGGGTLVTFEYLKGLDEDQRNSLLEFISHGHAINFGMPKGMTWDQEQPLVRTETK